VRSRVSDRSFLVISAFFGKEVEWEGALTLYPDSVRVRAGMPVRWTRTQGAGMMLVAAVLLWRKVKQNPTH
jgi:hypothetical protein